MKFAHLADVHVGAWRDPAMKVLALHSLKSAIDMVIKLKVDFVIIAGDFFNNAVPPIDYLQEAVILLKKLKKEDIPVYVVPGSHDYSAAGKTILDVLDEIGLLTIVMKGRVENEKLLLDFTTDHKTGVKLTGIGGKRGSLDLKEYAKLNSESLESEPGKKIFIFHAAIEELKPAGMEMMEATSINTFPKNFEYYAGGHVHVVDKHDFSHHKNVMIPGPIFPVNFQELWKLGSGGFYLYQDGMISHQKIPTKKVIKLEVDADDLTAEQVVLELKSGIDKHDFTDVIAMIKVAGRLKSGKTTDIDFKSIVQELYLKGAYFVMRSTTKLESQEFVEVRGSSGTAEQIEEDIISNHSGNKIVFEKKEKDLMKALINALSIDQNDGEKKYEYDERVKKEAKSVLD